MESASDRGKAPVSKERFSRVVIRKYEPKDRAAVRRICYDTGLMGDPIDPYFGCAELFADYWMNYYTDYEPESAFVAELDGKVIGYLVGCKDTLAQQEIRNIEIMPKIRRKFLTFGYRAEWRIFGYLWRYLRSMLRGEFADEPIGDYPAHLHINLAEGYRSGGIGAKLLFAYLDYLRENGVRGLHLGTTTYNKLATPFYEKRGFRLTARRPITMYEGIVPEKIEALFFVREVT
jgi:GNAT superfamily N-acetyltransferase